MKKLRKMYTESGNCRGCRRWSIFYVPHPEGGGNELTVAERFFPSDSSSKMRDQLNVVLSGGGGKVLIGTSFKRTSRR